MAQALLIGAAAVYTANAQQQAGQAQKKLANRNADLLDNSAADAIDRGNQDALQVTQRARRLRGAQRASFAGQGVDVNTGTAAALQEETTSMGEVDAAQVRKNAFREAWGIKTQAGNQRLGGDFSAAAGRNQAIGSVLGGIGDASRAYYQYDAPRVSGGGR